MKRTILYIITCLFLSGCVKVELCEISTHPHLYPLNVSYDWPSNLTEEELPDSMYIIANRLFNTLRYQFSYNLETKEGSLIDIWTNDNSYSPLSSRNGGEGTEGTGSTEGTEEELEPEIPELGEFSIRAGQYQMLTINHSELFTIDSLKEYMDDNSTKSADLGVSYHQYDYPRYKNETYNEWTDFNKGYKYVENPGAILYAQKTVNTEENHNVNINFDTERLTQEITFNLNIQLSGRDVVVDSVRAEISGVSQNVKLLSKYIDMDATRSCRMIFDMTPDAMRTDSVVFCTGKVHVLGLMNSEDETMKSGPGILHIAVYAHTQSQTKQIVKKTCYAGINLRNHILEQPLTMLTEDGLHHTISQPTVTIDIKNMLPISQNEILDILEPEHNIEYWFKEEDNKGKYDVEV